MRYLNRWSVSGTWVALMAVAWPVLVPDVLAVSTWILTAIAGPVLCVGGASLWESSRPTPSFGQSQLAADAREAAVRRRS